MRNSELYFLNVDLDIYHDSNIDDLVKYLGQSMYIVHNEDGIVSLEIRESGLNPENCIIYICKEIANLPKDLRKIWDSCHFKDFSIGLMCDKTKREQHYTIPAKISSNLADIDANLKICIYHV